MAHQPDRNWHPGQLLLQIPYQRIVMRRSQMVFNPKEAAYLEATTRATPKQPPGLQQNAMPVGQPTGMGKAESLSTEVIEPEDDTPPEPEPMIVAGTPVSAEEQKGLVKFFNDSQKRSTALSINFIGSKTMDEVESRRPLTWDTLVFTLTKAQLESAVKWYRGNPSYR
jgi:hypothetical protein